MTAQAVDVDKSSLRSVRNSSAGALEPCARLADHRSHCYAAKATIGSRFGGARDAARLTTTSTVSQTLGGRAPHRFRQRPPADSSISANFALQLWVRA